MTTDIRDETGPIDYLVIGFPGDHRTGEGLELIVELADRAIIRILDLVFVRKEPDGSVIRVAITDLDGDADVDLARFGGVASGILADDVDGMSAVLPPDSSAAIMIYENVWAAPLVAALRAAGAQVVASGQIRYAENVAALDALDVTDNGTR